MPAESPRWKLRLLMACLVWGLAPVEAGAADVRSYLRRPAEWYGSTEAERLGRNVVSWQAPGGGWPKNMDTVSTACTNAAGLRGTFDNGATTGELRFLGRLAATGRGQGDEFKEVFRRQFRYVLDAQYTNGGWPQSSPPPTGYGRHITYNDNAFLNLAELVRDVARRPEFEFAGAELRGRAGEAFARAIECVLRTQVRVAGERTVWCAQHDAVTLEPRPARSYELISLSGSESAGLLTLLMSLEAPTAEVRQAVEAGVRWFEKVRITGVREAREGGNKRLVSDATAPPMWARFYEIGTDRPMFAGRDGVKRYSYDEIEAERRNGYAWYGTWGTTVLEKYRVWKVR